MPRNPIGERAMTDAERQRRRRQRLREQQPNRNSHDMPQSDRARVRMLETLLQRARERQAELEADLRRAQEPMPAAHGITPELYRFVKGALHPDRVTDPAAKEYLQAAFVRFTELVDNGGGANLP